MAPRFCSCKYLLYSLLLHVSLPVSYVNLVRSPHCVWTLQSSIRPSSIHYAWFRGCLVLVLVLFKGLIKECCFLLSISFFISCRLCDASVCQTLQSLFNLFSRHFIPKLLSGENQRVGGVMGLAANGIWTGDLLIRFSILTRWVPRELGDMLRPDSNCWPSGWA